MIFKIKHKVHLKAKLFTELNVLKIMERKTISMLKWDLNHWNGTKWFGSKPQTYIWINMYLQ